MYLLYWRGHFTYTPVIHSGLFSHLLIVERGFFSQTYNWPFGPSYTCHIINFNYPVLNVLHAIPYNTCIYLLYYVLSYHTLNTIHHVWRSLRIKGNPTLEARNHRGIPLRPAKILSGFVFNKVVFLSTIHVSVLTSWTKSTCTCVNCFYCLPCKIKIVLLAYCLTAHAIFYYFGLVKTLFKHKALMRLLVCQLSSPVCSFWLRDCCLQSRAWDGEGAL